MGALLGSLWTNRIVPYNEATRSRSAAETLADRMRIARKQRAWTQQDLAEHAGTSQAVIQKIETGKSLRPRNIVAIAEALEVEPSWLMFGGGNPALSLSTEAISIAKLWFELSEPDRSNVKEQLMRLSGSS